MCGFAAQSIYVPQRCNSEIISTAGNILSSAYRTQNIRHGTNTTSVQSSKKYGVIADSNYLCYARLYALVH